MKSSYIGLADTYDDAWLHCACLFESGYSDWRMPISDELKTFEYDWEWRWHADTAFTTSKQSKIIAIRTTGE